MAETYVAVARLKLSSKDDEGPAEYIERGEKVTKSAVEDLDALIASGSVVTKERYEQMFPEVQAGSNQADGTPSNLEPIEGSVLQMNPPEEGDEVPATRVPNANPADVPVVDGAKEPGDDTSELDDEVDLEDTGA